MEKIYIKKSSESNKTRRSTLTAAKSQFKVSQGWKDEPSPKETNIIAHL